MAPSTPTGFGIARGDGQVTCIACGETVAREDAREYDKDGDSWDREGKSFEYLCKPCDKECCHQNRDGFEATLVEVGAGRTDRATFLGRYCEVVREEDARQNGA